MTDYINEMQTVILAGGLATRLGDLTKDNPKSMLKILGKPFMEYQLESLRAGGIEDIVICLGHLREQIESYFGDGREHGVNIRYSYEDNLLGTAGALKKAEPLLGDIFFTMYGDSYLFLDFAADENLVAVLPCLIKQSDDFINGIYRDSLGNLPYL
ncbi:NDP-sugar synthase [Chloroflexota bacterium]